MQAKTSLNLEIDICNFLERNIPGTWPRLVMELPWFRKKKETSLSRKTGPDIFFFLQIDTYPEGLFSCWYEIFGSLNSWFFICWYIFERSATSERKRDRSRDNFLEEPEVEFDVDYDYDDDDRGVDRDDIFRPPPWSHGQVTEGGCWSEGKKKRKLVKILLTIKSITSGKEIGQKKWLELPIK